MNPIEISRSENFQILSKYLLKGLKVEFSPQKILADITARKSVFDRRDIAIALSKIFDDQKELHRAIDVVLASGDLVMVEEDKEAGGRKRYSTWEMILIERGMIESAERMAGKNNYGVNSHHVENAIAQQDALLFSNTGQTLSEEQRNAVLHVTGTENITAVAGLAGAGKSTMLAAAREAWEAQGYRVHGGALSGKAAEGLEDSSGIRSRTLAAYEMSWKNGYGELGRGDIFVIDEAGMVSSRQLARFITRLESAGVKIVVVGDSEQLQAIEAGAPFRAIADKIGYAALENIIRQKQEWQREATKDLAQQRTADALAAYDRQGKLNLLNTDEETRAALVRDYLADVEENPENSRLAFAHRRVDVDALNQEIRQALKERGDLSEDFSYKTGAGERFFSVGDRIVFLDNDYKVGVKNGMLGTVIKIENGHLTARLDGRDRREVSICSDEYDAVSHGYAATVHKGQGVTTDRSFIFASNSYDRHLTYVAGSRHREDANFYASGEEFRDKQALLNRLSRTGLKETTLDYVVKPDENPAEKIRKAAEEAKESRKNKRVGWTQTYNLGDIDPQKAWQLMQGTADSADALKEAAGIRKGKKTEKPVYHYSITWPEEDKPSEMLQRKAVDEALKVLGLENHQAMAVQHLDGKPHVHVMLNLIDPDNGLSASTSVQQANGKKASKLSYARRKLRKWANDFEKQHGLKITEISHENIKRRDAGERVDAHRKTRNVYEREQREGRSPLTAWLRQRENLSAAEIQQNNRDMQKSYAGRFDKLNQTYMSKIQKLQSKKQLAVAKGQKEIDEMYAPKWAEVKRNNQKRLKEFEKSENSTVLQFFNSVTAYFQVKKETDSALQGLYAATSSQERRNLILRWNKQDVRALSTQERKDRKARISRIKNGFDKKIDRTQKAYLRTDSELRRRQKEEANEFRQRWRDYGVAREQNNQKFKGQDIDNAESLSQDQTLNRMVGKFQGQQITPK